MKSGSASGFSIAFVTHSISLLFFFQDFLSLTYWKSCTIVNMENPLALIQNRIRDKVASEKRVI